MSDYVPSIVLGIGLAAATGFRVFLPLLVVSVAAYTGHLPLDDKFAWLGTLPALVMLGVAAVIEILAYYIPVIDNLLDTIAMPAAAIAGTIITVIFLRCCRLRSRWKKGWVLLKKSTGEILPLS
jgi:uncharacterized membrane protein